MADKTNKEQLTKRICLRFHPSELKTVTQQQEQTACQSLSAYIRKKALDQPITFYTRDRSMDAVAESLTLLKAEVNSIGNNLNQAVHRLHLLNEPGQTYDWIKKYEGDVQNTVVTIQKVHDMIAQFADIWLQK